MNDLKSINRERGPLRGDELALCGLAAVLRLCVAGVPIGVGNQALHMVFVEHLRNPGLFQGDLLLDTLPHFSTLFFHAFAALLPAFVSLEAVLAVAHLLTTGVTFAAFAALVRGIWPDTRKPCLILIPLAGLALSGLAESPLNPLGFSHTSLAFALSLVVLNLLVRGRIGTALALTGLLANIHLLTAATTAALAGMWGLWHLRTLPPSRTVAGLLAGAVLAAPMLPHLLQSPGGFDAGWIQLLELRSAHHVFPSVWWRPGNPGVARFALWAGWTAVARGLSGGRSRHTDPWIAAAAVLMALGWLGAEVMPLPLVMRAQLFRASGTVVVVALLLSVRAVDMLLRPRPELPLLMRGIAPVAVVAFAAILWLPVGQPVAAPALLAAAWMVWAARRLSPAEALVAGGAIVVATLSDIQLQTNFWTPELAFSPDLAVLLLLGVLALFALSMPLHPGVRLAIAPAAVVMAVAALALWPAGAAVPDLWADIQAQTRRATPPEAVILTPPRQSGFRVGARRAVVGEWRDGTQQFFDPAFAVRWAERMAALDADRTRHYAAADWIAAADRWGADFLVLPRNDRLPLIRVAENAAWMLCRPELPPPPPLPPPPDNAIDPDDWLAQERFMHEVVTPSLQRHRTTAVSLRLLDAAGRPLPGVPVELEQTGRAFHIGSALNHFSEPAAHSREFRAPLVHAQELERFTEVFNYSVIGFSGKWNVLEPVQGERNMEPLDRYIDWCHRHGIAVEYHFVCGYEPPWLRHLSPEEQQATLLRHADDLIDRYGDRVAIWQIVNERRLQALAPAVFERFRERLPGARLGVSHCARFYADREDERRERDLLRGWDSVTELQDQGVTVDYFGVHAHRPMGTWWDPRTIYEVLDTYAERGMRVRVTETGISHAGKIMGSVLKGDWDEALQADYLQRFLTVLYSHPNVDGVNFWGFGPHTWQRHISLLDEAYEPRPAFHALDRLVNDTWKTRAALESSREGRIRFAGFHGDYRLLARMPDGTTASATFHLAADSPESFDVRLSPPP